MRRAVLASAIVMLVGCGKNGVNPVSPDSGNRAPVITSVQLDPAMVPPGGTAAIRVVASDPDNDPLTVQYTVDHGVVTPSGSPAWTATYQEQGPSNDTLHVTVTDNKLASAKRDVMIPVGSSATPTPTATPTATPTPNTQPAPTISVSGPDSCYPYPSCGASMTASGSNYASLSWSGCCSGSGTASTCNFTDLGAHTCTVTATGPGGTATANKVVTGTNTAPVVQYTGNSTGSGALACNLPDVAFGFQITDEENSVYQCAPATVNGPPVCQYLSMECPAAGYPSLVNVHISTLDHHAGVLCYVTAEVRDRFGAAGSKTWAVSVAACP